jgi:phosphoribosylformylglycinamidine synthase
MGERTPLAVLDAPGFRPHGDRRGADQPRRRRHRAAGRGQAVGQLDGAVPAPGEDARLFDTVEGRLRPLPAIGVSIPVGKDSLSMRTAWEDGGEKKQVVSPLSLIVTAFAAVDDVRKTLTPQLARRSAKPNCC